MKILMATSEFAPLTNAGGLGDQVKILATELKKSGHDVSVALPCYRSAQESKQSIRSAGIDFQINLGGKKATAEILETVGPDEIQTFLVRRDEYFDRSGIYGSDGRAYEDNAERFIFFAKAVLELSRHLSPTPDILHSHDWPTALIPVFVKERQLPFLSVLSIYSLEHQGSFWSFDFALTNLPGSYFGPRGVEFYGRLNFLKAGILYSDAVVLPGELAVDSGLSAEGGYGLHLVLQENASRTFGILPGVDYTVTNLPLDKLLGRRQRNGNYAGKAAAREAALKQFGLNPTEGLVLACASQNPSPTAFGEISSLLDLILSGDQRLLIAGDIPAEFLPDVLVAERKYPGRLARVAGEDRKTHHLLLAGADALILPQLTEREYIDLVAALRYGTIPITSFRRGLSQLVQDLDPSANDGFAFVYYRQSAAALRDAVRRAQQTHRHAEHWNALVERARAVDFSWSESAKAYVRLYSNLLRHRQAA